MDGENTNGQGGTQDQGQTVDPGLGSAMDSWGDGDRGNVGENQTSQTSQTSQQSAATTQQTGQQSQQAATTQQSQTAQTQTVTTPSTDTAAAVRAAVEATAAAMANQATRGVVQQQAAKPMSDEEFAKHYNLPLVDAKGLERLFDKDPAAGAAYLNQLLRQTYTGALRMSKDLYESQLAERIQAFQPKIAEMDRFIAEQREVQATNAFYAAYPTLTAERDLVKEVLDATYAKISRKELSFKSQNEAFKYVADATNRVLARMNSAGGGQNNGSNGQQSSTGRRQMASATSSARPGGQNAGKGNEVDQMMASWDARPE